MIAAAHVAHEHRSMVGAFFACGAPMGAMIGFALIWRRPWAHGDDAR
jgi:hypothetical protein